VIDVFSEELIDLRRVCRESVFRNPNSNKPAHISSVYRHVLRGALAVNGDRVKLEVVKTPSGLRTSREAIQRFVERLTNPGTSTAAPTPAARRRAVAAANAELDAAGI
jgi:hypothetical protein